MNWHLFLRIILFIYAIYPIQLIASQDDIVSKIRDLPEYFPVGYELELYNPKILPDTDFNFQTGAQFFFRITASVFGANQNSFLLKKVVSTNYLGEEGKANDVFEWKDFDGNTWTVADELVNFTPGDLTSNGWELITPPFFRQSDISKFAVLMNDVIGSQYGLKPGNWASVHQTLDLRPIGADCDENMVANTMVNAFLLLESHMFNIHKILRVERLGGWKNFTTRPFVLDHSDPGGLLSQLSKLPNRETNFKTIREIFSDPHVLDQEKRSQYASHIVNHPEWKGFDLTNKDLKKWIDHYTWKHRSTKIVWLKSGKFPLLEIRIADYKPNLAKILTPTLLYQQIFTKALQLARAKKRPKLKFIYRGQMNDKNYAREQQNLYSINETLTTILANKRLSGFFSSKIEPLKRKTTSEPSLLRSL